MIPLEYEIMLRHLSVDEALARLDQFLNTAYSGGLTLVRIIHGKGTGILRLEVRRELTGHPLVESFRPADSREGGAGVTVVKLAQN